MTTKVGGDECAWVTVESVKVSSKIRRNDTWWRRDSTDSDNREEYKESVLITNAIVGVDGVSSSSCIIPPPVSLAWTEDEQRHDDRKWVHTCTN